MLISEHATVISQPLALQLRIRVDALADGRRGRSTTTVRRRSTEDLGIATVMLSVMALKKAIDSIELVALDNDRYSDYATYVCCGCARAKSRAREIRI